MLQSFLSSFLPVHASNDMQMSRRRHPRRESDRCICTMYGQTFPVENWSFGGVLVTADDRMFGMGQDVAMTIKFKLRNTILDIAVEGQVVRKNQGRIGIRFEALPQTIRRNFQLVVDDQVAREFANSQVPV